MSRIALHGGRDSRLVPICTLSFALCTSSGLLAVARAQPVSPPPASQASDGPPLYADFGFAGKIPAERWSPITVWVLPGDRALGGVVVTEFDQDATQSARIVTPFAATPNTPTPVQIVAALPEMTDEVTFTLFDERGGRIQRLEYSTLAGSRSALLPPTLRPEDGLFLCVGKTSLPEAMRFWTDPSFIRPPGVSWRQSIPSPDLGPLTDDERELAWLRANAASVDPSALPLSWVAYDGVTVLVVDADAAASVDARALEAVRAWVEGGGRLLLLAHSAGSRWRSWLPDGAAGDLVEIGEPVRSAPPAECLTAMEDEAARDRIDRLPDEAEGEVKARPPVPPAAESIIIRPIALTPAAEEEGWQVRWGVGRLSEPMVGHALAEGPLGLGWVTVLGFEPRTISNVLSARAAGAVWREALRTPASTWLESIPRAQNPGWWMDRGSESQSAAVSLLSRIATLPVVGDAIFLAIALCMLGLALLVGPFDAFVLRRLGARQRSWITALGWIGLASAGAYAAPVLMRSGPSQIFRVSILDQVVSRPGRPVFAPCQTGLTGVFAAQSGETRFRDPDQSAWWRGVSAIQSYLPTQERIIGTVATTQDAAGGMLGASRGNPLERISLGLWTFRAFMDRSRPGPLLATVDRNGAEWVVTLSGLSPACVVAGYLRVGADWYPIPTSRFEQADGSRRWAVNGALAQHASPAGWHRAGAQEWQPWVGYQAQGAGITTRPGMAASLPGALERSLALDQRIASGRWAALYLYAWGWPSDVAIDWASTVDHTAVFRLAVPLDEADRVPAGPLVAVPRWNADAQQFPGRAPSTPPVSSPPVGPMGPAVPPGEPVPEPEPEEPVEESPPEDPSPDPAPDPPPDQRPRDNADPPTSERGGAP